MRMMSKSATGKIYHRAECRYVRRIHKRNRIQMNWEDAEWKGYRACKYCNSDKFLYGLEEKQIELFAEKYNLDVDMADHAIYVRTDVGCWKIIYKNRRQRFILLHRNYVNGRIPLEQVEAVPYHRQKDMPESGKIMKYLKYIQKHDSFKQNKPADYRRMPQDTKKQKAYYRAAQRREEKKSASRLDSLFTLIEDKEGIKKLSYS